jgi:transcriptional antiterminator RfaH
MGNWYVMQSKPNREFFLQGQLVLNHVETYLPLIKTVKTNGRTSYRPFFPGYLFVNVDLNERGTSSLQWIPGSKGIVMFGDQPPSVPDQFIEQLKNKLRSLNIKDETKFSKIPKGYSVLIQRGAFQGYRALFSEYLPEGDRVKLLLKTLADKAFYIKMPAEDIKIFDK